MSCGMVACFPGPPWLEAAARSGGEERGRRQTEEERASEEQEEGPKGERRQASERAGAGGGGARARELLPLEEAGEDRVRPRKRLAELLLRRPRGGAAALAEGVELVEVPGRRVELVERPAVREGDAQRGDADGRVAEEREPRLQRDEEREVRRVEEEVVPAVQ